MSEMKPCPFCGSPAVDIGSYVNCTNNDCMAAYEDFKIDHWNRRPVEDALRDRIAKLEAALREILECEVITDNDYFTNTGEGYECKEVRGIIEKALEVG